MGNWNGDDDFSLSIHKKVVAWLDVDVHSYHEKCHKCHHDCDDCPCEHHHCHKCGCSSDWD